MPAREGAALWRRKGRVRRTLRGIALSILWLLILAVCLEVGLRLLPQAVPLAFLPRSDGGPPARTWFCKPGFVVRNHDDEEGVVAQVQMDRNGLCNSPAELYDAPRFDVIALGDVDDDRRDVGHLPSGAFEEWAVERGASRMALSVGFCNRSAETRRSSLCFEVHGDREPLRPGSRVQVHAMKPGL